VCVCWCVGAVGMFLLANLCLMTVVLLCPARGRTSVPIMVSEDGENHDVDEVSVSILIRW
jgi:hypothetical protein